MWNINITNNNDDTLNIVATNGGFSFPSTIKSDDDSIAVFVTTAKAQYENYLADKSKVDSLATKIANLFN